VIQPGRAGQLKITMDTSGLSGAIGKGVSITTNDPHTAVLRVVVRAVVLGSVEVSPGKKAILSNRTPQTKSKLFLIRKEPTETGELSVGSLAASSPWIDVQAEFVESRRVAADGIPTAVRGDWILRAALKSETLPTGRTQEWVRFATGLPREPEITIALATDLQPPVTLNLPALTMVAGQPKVVLASLRQDLEYPQPIEITASEGLTARIEPSRRRFFKIVLEWNGDVPVAAAELKLEVAGESQTVPVTVTAAN
jgi:hypothetical protein